MDSHRGRFFDAFAGKENNEKSIPPFPYAEAINPTIQPRLSKGEDGPVGSFIAYREGVSSSDPWTERLSFDCNVQPFSSFHCEPKQDGGDSYPPLCNSCASESLLGIVSRQLSRWVKQAEAKRSETEPKKEEEVTVSAPSVEVNRETAEAATPTAAPEAAQEGNPPRTECWRTETPRLMQVSGPNPPSLLELTGDVRAIDFDYYNRQIWESQR